MTFTTIHRAAALALVMSLCPCLILQAAQSTPDGALEAAREEVAENPRSVEAQLALARAALAENQHQEALRAAAAARSLAPDDSRVLPVLTRAQIQAGQLEDALTTYEAMSQDVRADSGLESAIRGIRLKQQADAVLRAAEEPASQAAYRQAAELLDNAVAAAPDVLQIRKSLGFIYLDRLQQPERALPHVEAAARIAPGDAEAVALLGRALLELGNFERSEAVFRQLTAEQPDDLSNTLNLAESLIGLGRRQEAIEILLRVTRQNPEHQRAEELLAEARRADSQASEGGADVDLQTDEARRLLREANEYTAEGDRTGSIAAYRAAVARLRQALLIEPRSHTLHQTLGYVLLEKLGEPCLAYRELSKALAIRPNHLETLKLLALASLRTGRHCQAIDLFHIVLRRDPTDLWMRVNLGRAWARASEYKRALAIYRSVLAQDPGNFTARLGIAETLAWQGYSHAPFAIAGRLTQEEPGNSEAHALLGDLYRWDWDFGLAATEYRRAQATDPAGRAGLEGLSEIEKAQSVVASTDGYQFEDNFGFRRGFIGGSVRVPLTDKAYLIPRGVYWEFEQGPIALSRTDAIMDLEYHFNRHLQSTLRFLNYDYSNRDSQQAGILSLQYTPTSAVDLYASASANEPAVLTDINIPLFNIRMNSYSAGYDIDLSKRWSTQGSFSYGDYSDSNERRFGTAQLSYKALPCNDVFLRLKYEDLSFADQTPLYFSPQSFDLLRLGIDYSLPVYRNLSIEGESEAICVLGEGWGHAFRVGPSWQLDDQIVLQAAYFETSIPGATPFSGDGFDFFASYRF